MAALFSPRTSTAFRVAAFCLGALVVFAICFPMIIIRMPYASGRGDPVEQPIAFDHRHHVRDDGIDCIYCHDTVETEASAGMPSTERCMGCHSQIWRESPKLEPLRTSWNTKTPLRWRRINAVPAYVYFHHGVHVQRGIACDACHGDVSGMPRVVRVRDLSMSFCLDCHRREQGSRAITRLTTCSACHR